LFYDGHIQVMTNDNRISLIKISRGLKDALNNAGFTIESILDKEPSKIAQDLELMNMSERLFLPRLKRNSQVLCMCS
jgi:hypothetical protein